MSNSRKVFKIPGKGLICWMIILTRGHGNHVYVVMLNRLKGLELKIIIG